MALDPATRVGPYEIVSPLGAGGMGEVYRARDTRLNREVAIKVLHTHSATDAERMVRFNREAQLLASLNHPNIGAIYGLEDALGAQALVMELVEGPTLAERIAQGRLAVPDSVAIAIQIAQALEVAHERGIIHRDLKPANIKVTADGTVKVLDFGLAKALDPPTALDTNALNSPTLSAHATHAGIILGTAAYMAPEQARGLPVDRRADVWAFGCVLFEMLTGQRPFAGDTVTDTMAAVLSREPEWSSLPEATPDGVRRLLKRCLTKDVKRRLRDLSDARLDLEETIDEPVRRPATAGGTSRRERVAWGAAVALLAVIAAGFGARSFRAATPPAEMRVEITTPPGIDAVSIAISPDGQKVVFVGAPPGQTSRLWMRRLSGGEAEPLPGTEVAHGPFWSADSRSVGFFAAGKLKRIDIDGGAVAVLADAPLGEGGTWNQDGTVVFAPVPASELYQVSAAGGDAPRRDNGRYANAGRAQLPAVSSRRPALPVLRGGRTRCPRDSCWPAWKQRNEAAAGRRCGRTYTPRPAICFSFGAVSSWHRRSMPNERRCREIPSRLPAKSLPED